MNKRIDLHIHTNLSDGALSPIKVIDEAVKNGVGVISITDHDTCDAYNEKLYDYAKIKNIQIIPGVEISTKWHKVGIHVLGYNFDINHLELKQRLFLLRNARHDYLYNVADKLEQLGYILNISELDKIAAVTKAHIALDVINNPKNQNLLLEKFGHLPNKGEFIETVMNEGCPAYVRKDTITPKEAAKLIRRAGGKVILAHPVAYQYEDNLSDDDVLMLIKDMDADGIEANYIYIDQNNNKINDCDKWRKFINGHHLIATIGSDFHEDDGIHPKVGLINEELNIDDAMVDKIISNLIG